VYSVPNVGNLRVQSGCTIYMENRDHQRMIRSKIMLPQPSGEYQSQKRGAFLYQRLLVEWPELPIRRHRDEFSGQRRALRFPGSAAAACGTLSRISGGVVPRNFRETVQGMGDETRCDLRLWRKAICQKNGDRFANFPWAKKTRTSPPWYHIGLNGPNCLG
jgi:hypothetical protein